MKRLTSFANLLVFLALLAPVTTAQSKSDWQRDNLVGSVRSMQVEFAEANAVDGKLVEIKRWPHQRVTYNERGHEVERVNFNQDGTEQDRSVIRYDSEGRIIGYGDAKKDRYHSTIEYDSKGNRIEARMYEGDVIQTREVYTYDDKGRKIEQSRFADGGAYHERLTYAYNAAGQLTEMAAYYSGTLKEKHLKTYNGAGDLVREASVNYELPGQDWTVEYSYDKLGREIERYVDTAILWSKVQTLYDAKGRVAQRTTFMEYKQPNVMQSHAPEPGRVVFRYNDRGQVLEEAVYKPDAALASKTVFTYDKVGKLIEEAHVSSNVRGDLKVSYEYDSHGNWIKRTKPNTDHTGRQYIYVEHRAITYY
jgi:antitoxin component YwqK of YwqJK toxin-antitoxin module